MTSATESGKRASRERRVIPPWPGNFLVVGFSSTPVTSDYIDQPSLFIREWHTGQTRASLPPVQDVFLLFSRIESAR